MLTHTTGTTNQRQRTIPVKWFLPFLLVLIAVAAVVVAQSTSYRIFLIGDSTVCDYAESKYPFTGWGQLFSPFFNKGTVTVNNRAIGGRSTKKFYVEGRWGSVVQELRQGDYVFIQFGHNDRDASKADRYADTNTYKSYLRLYADESRAKGAIPVFVTPMNMNTWNGTTVRRVFTEFERGADYCGAMKNIAEEKNVPVIDLEAKSAEFMKSVGKTYLEQFHHMGLARGEYPNYPDGYSDKQTHFQEMGSIINARMVAEGIQELASHDEMGKLAEVLAPLYKLTVTPNKENTGLITVSGDFPAGVTITVKVRPNSGETFLNWADGTISDVSSKSLYMFTMPEEPVTMYALFRGGDPVSAIRKKSEVAKATPNLHVTVNKTSGILHISSPAPVSGITLYSLSGKTIFSERYTNRSDITLPLHSLGNGKHIVECTTGNSRIRHAVTLP